MAAISVLINDNSLGPFNIAELFAGNTYSGGVTVNPATPLLPPSKPAYMSIQNDPANPSISYVYVGDSTLDTGVPQYGVSLKPGESTVVQNVVQALAQRYVSSPYNGVQINIEVLGGFQ